ncbi:peptidase inhibitor family I36 protein [Streptomyces sp. NPDC099050]|uniref:peptidase inhibitor family I36 protein n=1 Tax=Streptomyces sp. NPDC099050 TaxID=3366100 RepID=UPI00380F6661
MKIHFKRGSLIASVIVLLGTLFTASPAGANTAYENCDDNRLCLYTAESGQMKPDGSGSAPLPRTYEAHISPPGYPADFENATISFWNRTGYWACLYSESKWGGTVQAVPPLSKADGENELSPAMKAAGVSSHKFAPSMALCFTGYERCADGYLCLFKEKNGRGEMVMLANDVTTYAPTWDNQVESVRNRTDKIACFRPGTASSTEKWTTAAPAATYSRYLVHAGDLTNLTAPYADSISSHHLDPNSDFDEDCKP